MNLYRKSLAVAALTLALSPSALAGTLRVPGDHATIQAAIDTASPGDTIMISSGTYAPFTVTKNDLTLKADESGPSPVVQVSAFFQAAVTIPASGVTVQGLSTVAPSGTLTFGFFVTGHGNTLRNNSVATHFVGFRENGGMSNTYAGNTATGCGTGFADRGCIGIVYKDNHASACTNGFSSGAPGQVSIGSTYKENFAVDCALSGYTLRGIRDSIIRDNVAMGCGAGFQLTSAGPSGGSYNNSLRENGAIGNAHSGFVMDGGSDANDLRENDSADNGEYGYFVAELLGNAFRENECDNNALGGSNQPGICD